MEISLTVAAFITFLVLKLTGVIDWSWWWITAPLWISAALFFLVLVFAGLVAVIGGKWLNKWNL